MRGPELDRTRDRDEFDPAVEGARYRLSRELSLVIWERVSADATDGAGRRDSEQARRRFHEIAALVAARGGRLQPDVGRLTRVDIELSGEMPEVSRSPLRTCAPGRETLVAAEARRRSQGHGEQATATADAIARLDLPGANDVAQAMAALQLPARPERTTPPQVSGYERMSRLLEVDLSNSHRRVRESHFVWPRPAESLDLRAFARAPEAPARIPEPAEPGWTLDLRLRLAEVDALQEVVQFALDSLTSGRLPDHGLGSALVSSPRHPATRSDAGAFRPHLMARDADAGDSWTPGHRSVAPWITGGGAPLTDVAHRRAATIFRRELADADVDLHDPAIEEALSRAGHGEPLPESVRQDMEAQLGASFRNVRVHTDSVATRAAELLHASAFTLGEDIFFAAGAFAPSGESGQRLLVHELTHVVQSQQGRVPAGHGTEVSRPSDALEQEAATAYDRITTRVAALNERVPSGSPRLPEPRMLLRAPGKRGKAKAPGRNVQWLSPDAKFVIGFVDGLIRTGGKGLTPDTLGKIKRDFTNPNSIIEIYNGVQLGALEGMLRDLWDNIKVLGHIAEWLFWNATPAGQLRDIYEQATDPVGKATRDKQKKQRERDFIDGMLQFAGQLAKDPGIVADLGEELGQAAGDYVARLCGDFANATPSVKGRWIGKALGYLVMEIALLFVGPELLAAKVPAAVAKLGRAGGKVAQALLRLMERIPGLRKLLQAAGWLGKTAEKVSPEAKLLAHLEESIVKNVLLQKLSRAELARLAKLEKATAEKLLKELPAKDVLALEKRLGKAKLEKLAKDKSVKELQAIAEKGAAAGVAGADRGFHSFSAFKRAMGVAGKGKEWHHIVEQTTSNVAKFGTETIHNTRNLVALDAPLHRRISAFYSSKQPFTGGQTVRRWLGNQSLQEQMKFGQQILQRFAGAP